MAETKKLAEVDVTEYTDVSICSVSRIIQYAEYLLPM